MTTFLQVFVVSGAELNLEIMQVYVVSWTVLFEFCNYAFVFDYPMWIKLVLSSK